MRIADSVVLEAIKDSEVKKLCLATPACLLISCHIGWEIKWNYFHVLFVLFISDHVGMEEGVSRAERNCTGRAEQNYTTERRGVSIEVSWYLRT